MGDKIQSVTDSSFADMVLNAALPVLVDFWAPWCGPCKAMGPTLEKLADQYEGRATIVKCNVDENPEIPHKYNIRSIPTLMIFHAGALVDQKIGVVAGASLAEVLDKVLSGEAVAAPFQMA